jgi:hypothetical protein
MGALHKCWFGFVIAIKKIEWDKIEIYVVRIQHLEKDLNKNNRFFRLWNLIRCE